MKASIGIVHLVDEANQPDIKIRCTQYWTRPAWMQLPSLHPQVFRTEDDLFYAHDRLLVNCPGCLEEA